MAVSTVFEKHFKLLELAELWGFDDETLRRWFQDEPGVLTQGDAGVKRGKREKISMRIPKSVAERVYCQRVRR